MKFIERKAKGKEMRSHTLLFLQIKKKIQTKRKHINEHHQLRERKGNEIQHYKMSNIQFASYSMTDEEYKQQKEKEKKVYIITKNSKDIINMMCECTYRKDKMTIMQIDRLTD